MPSLEADAACYRPPAEGMKSPTTIFQTAIKGRHRIPASPHRAKPRAGYRHETVGLVIGATISPMDAGFRRGPGRFFPRFTVGGVPGQGSENHSSAAVTHSNDMVAVSRSPRMGGYRRTGSHTGMIALDVRRALMSSKAQTDVN